MSVITILQDESFISAARTAIVAGWVFYLLQRFIGVDFLLGLGRSPTRGSKQQEQGAESAASTGPAATVPTTVKNESVKSDTLDAENFFSNAPFSDNNMLEVLEMYAKLGKHHLRCYMY